ncbi:MAG TPA: 3-oxoacid CoA-transferase subunit A [Xanthobacteraceae bacterium]|nr:3-oxoacid CoA-transferase subunit A [Xanthobacteraceae bacterium]
MIDKRVSSLAEAVSGVKDGATVLLAGFGSVGEPVELIEALHDTGVRDLVVVANNAGLGDTGLARLIGSGRVRKIICSFPRTADPHCFDAAYRAGKLELELVPQGTLSERIRAGGAGIAAFYTRVSAGTEVANGKEVRQFAGQPHVLEEAIRGDLALIRAETGDRWGNLTYRLSARNFNPVMAMAADLTVAQVSQFVELGSIDPDHVHTPGIFVDRIVAVPRSHSA